MNEKSLKTATFCYYLVALIDVIFGLVYLSYPTVLPYHLKILQMPWQDVPMNFRLLLLGAMRVVGACSVSCGILMGLMVHFPFQRREKWARWSIPSVGLLHWSILLYVTSKLAYKTSTWTPWPFCLLVLGILLFGAVFSWRKASMTP